MGRRLRQTRSELGKFINGAAGVSAPTRPLTLPSATPEGGLIVDSTQPRRPPRKRKTRKTCQESGCRSRVHARSRCNRHYLAWRKATPLDERRLTSADRFWAKVNRDGPVPAHAPDLGPCWIWTGATSHWGYGKLRADNRWYMAHRRSYEVANGSVPTGLFVCHRCDTPACVRPAHLFLGTAQQNTQDMHMKGRAALCGAEGERNSHAKLLDEQVLGIRERFEQGEMIIVLAAEFALGRGAISDIVNGRTWKHLGGPIRPRGQIGRRARKVA